MKIVSCTSSIFLTSFSRQHGRSSYRAYILQGEYYTTWNQTEDDCKSIDYDMLSLNSFEEASIIFQYTAELEFHGRKINWIILGLRRTNQVQ